jgi:CDP-Glycerol:Poly(glycerophosphate) glycerophosphotransferase
MKNKTLLITVFHSLISKNFLNTEAFSLLKLNPNLDIVLVVPKNKEAYFKELYECPCVRVKGFDLVDIYRRGKVRFFSIIGHLLLQSHYLWYKKVERRDKSTSHLRFIKYYSEILFTTLFAGVKCVRSLFRLLFVKMVKVEEISTIFDEYSPDVVFSTDVFDEMDVLVNREARTRKLCIVGMVRSWDNCYSKGILRVVPNMLMVNNEEIQKEAISIQDVLKGQTRIVGLPQYDQFVTGIRSDRRTFFKKIGADPNKKLIIFSPAGAGLSDVDWQLCNILKCLVDEKIIQEPVTFLVRNHPHHPADLSMFKGGTNFIIENPGMSFGQNGKEVELTKGDSNHLADSLYHSDMVVYVATTLGNDSLLFDKPQIIIDFDGWEKREYTHSVRRYHDEDHMKKMLACGGVSIVKNKKELADAINLYLKNPQHMQEGRRRALLQQVYYTDGKSGERITQCLVDELKKVE